RRGGGGWGAGGGAAPVVVAQGRVVPAAVTCSGGPNQYASLWVGIDGFNSNSVEQTGTDSDCQNGAPTYYAWFEFYPHPSFVINSLSIRPGDVVTAEVKYAGRNQFTVSLTDVTTGQTFSTTTKVNAQRSSAEGIAEAPSSAGGILPLADFGFADFGQSYTSRANTAMINGVTLPIGSFGNVSQITMVSQADGTTVKAQPSSLSSDKNSFSDSWYSPGP